MPSRAEQPHVVIVGGGFGGLAAARRLGGKPVQVTLVDRQGVVSAETCRQFERLWWNAYPITSDVFDWMGLPSSHRVDLMAANLFLHHFPRPALARLMEMAAERTDCFIACEPRRCLVSALASRWLWLIGCNAVTRHDAVLSVRAGFVGEELSALWPKSRNWQLQERAAGLFSHCFVARRRGGAKTCGRNDD